MVMHFNFKLVGGMILLVTFISLVACSSTLPTEPTVAPSATLQVISETPISEETPTQTETSPTPEIVLPTESGLVFADYEAQPVNAVPSVSHEPIAADLSNVRIPFALSQEMLDRLAEDGIVVSPGEEKEFFTVYEKARYNNEPIFVTSDALLHVYHLIFDKILRTAEVEYFIPLLADLNRAMLAQTDAQYQELLGTEWEDAARRAVAFVGVASKLLDPNVALPEYAAELVEAELALVNAAAGMQPSPLFPGLAYGEDYTQYIPRGHYTRSEELERYFKSMMWYGRMTFRLKTDDPEVGREETKAALLLVYALNNAQINGTPAWDAWDDLYNSTVFFVGRSDDLTPTQYAQLMEAIYGQDPPVTALVDDSLLDQFITAAEQLPPPRILGMVIMETDDIEETTKGMRFMGQRFVPDAYIFRQLIYRNVGTPDNRRGLPMGLDIPAAMGSQRAYQILDQLGETSYPNYPEQMEKMQSWTASLSEAEWTETLYNSWLYSFYPLLEVPGEGYPEFMLSEAWLDKQLNTVLGSWAELKHDTILYAKQVYAELGAGPPPPPPLPPAGYVEPVPGFFARLAALTEMTRSGLSERELLNEMDDLSLKVLEKLALALKEISESELQNQPLTEEQQETIRFIGGELENLTMAAADSDVEDPFAPKYMDEEPQAAVIADVATDPDHPGHVVLEEGVGRVNPIYVVVPINTPEGETYLQVNKGAVFSYYEFVWPADDRLTDEKWRQMLEEGNAPPFPEWVTSFMSESGSYDELNQAVSAFQKLVTQIYWEPQSFSYIENPAVDRYQAEIDSLAADSYFVAHQLTSSDIRSFDLQGEEKAIVTVQEVWQDKMSEGAWPEYDLPLVAERGPYTLDATYTIELIREDLGPTWQVTSVVYANEPPDWEYK